MPPATEPALRALMPALAGKTYFNYGGQGPLPEPSLEAITSAFRRINALGPFSDAVWPFADATVSGLRRRLAAWLAVAPHRLAFTENVSAGCVLPLWGLSWREGEELLLSDAEHPGVVAACRELARRHQLRLTTLAVNDLRADPAATAASLLERLEAQLSPRTRLVVLSHLLWNTGQLMPIAAVAARLAAHANHPWLLVDGAQSLGSLPLDQPGSATPSATPSASACADIYACTGHKWCCGPEGLGVVAVSERLLAEASPTLIGWRSLRNETSGGSDFHRDARRFEVATVCTPLFAGLSMSLQLLEAEGDAAARLERIQALSAQLWQGLQALPGMRPLLSAPPPAGLVSFEAPGDPGQQVKRLGERAIWLRSLPAPSCLRACTHITSTTAEIDQLLAALQGLSGH
ncbi:MAG: aminotransferase class V-fold PLP-dependent enzyme [Synechococcaceae cyanobacterium]|nr:aminotransferase class V-fold PLP-dependent enzyme [Synechococcaceae cyanobacterium]